MIDTGEVVATGAGIAIQPDGRIVVTGSCYYQTTIYNYFMFLARLTADGVPDAGFGLNGVVTPDLGTTVLAMDSTRQTDGKIIVCVRLSNNTKVT